MDPCCGVPRDGSAHDSCTCFTVGGLLPLTPTDAEDRVTCLRYQPNGTLAQVTDGNGHSTGYAPDDFDRLATITHADSTTEQFRYDPDSNRKTTRPRGW